MKLDSKGTLFAGVVLAGTTILITACVSNNCPKDSDTILPTFVNDPTLEITFDTAGCPKKVNFDDFFLTKSKKVFWQSVDQSGKKTSAQYSIYFDPFKGKTFEAKPGSEGKIEATLDPDAPKKDAGVVYTYTIVGDKCKDKPLDPRFRLR